MGRPVSPVELSFFDDHSAHAPHYRMRFFMHCDYQLAYCPLTYIVALAFRDNAFENERLTPEIFWQLRIPKRLHVLPIKWKKSKLKNFPSSDRRNKLRTALTSIRQCR